MNVSFDFSGKVALVTGGGSGIGRASAEAFGRSGATVLVADISEEYGTETVKLILSAGGTAEFFRVDVADVEQVDGLIEAIVARFGRIDFAHNNAGIEGTHVPVAEISVNDWRRVIEIDLNAIFYCMRAEIPVMQRQGSGAIVNTSSASGLIGGYNLGAYTAAKHGVIGLTRAAALDYGSQGIRINAVCPGPIDTPFLAELPKAARDRLVFATGLDRLGQAEEVAQAVLWLCSEGSSYVTGLPLSVDGGVAVGGMGTRFDDIDMSAPSHR
jgi:NAD(P)-dependent dehydrogenase (short-subunit alcohol dehydrogenase family)